MINPCMAPYGHPSLNPWQELGVDLFAETPSGKTAMHFAAEAQTAQDV